MKRALITGINGQDGSFLAEFLLSMNYEVHGVIRRPSIENSTKLKNIGHIIDKIKIHSCDIENQLAIYKLIEYVCPDEVYHLAAQSFVDYSFGDSFSLMSTNFNPTLFLLASINQLNPDCKFYFAGSSEMIGEPEEYPQNENSKFNPRSLYGISKLASYYVVKNYREKYNLYACTGIAYNHESPRRGYQFVTRKITSGLANIYHGKQQIIELGNIDAIRDWGYAPDYVRAMWLMLNNPNGPNDYIIATGIPHTVRDFLKIAFGSLRLDYQEYIEISKKFYRPSEEIPLIGDSSKLKRELKWQTTKTFDEIVQEMVQNDVKK